MAALFNRCDSHIRGGKAVSAAANYEAKDDHLYVKGGTSWLSPLGAAGVRQRESAVVWRWNNTLMDNTFGL